MAIAHVVPRESLPVVAPSRRERYTRMFLVVALAALACASLACSGVADEGKLPPDVQDPATLRTPSGAMARYRGVLALLPQAFDPFVTKTGILTDELAALPTAIGLGGEYTALDSRTKLASTMDDEYAALHRLRTDAQEARGFVQAYAPDSSPALTAHLYALEGYADMLLADLFCSGIPLGTVDFEGDYTLQPGVSTAEVYRHAIARFDSALALATDSARIQYLAAIGRGRALLALGQYATAAAAVAVVPDGYVYQIEFDRLRWSLAGHALPLPAAWPNMGDREGGNGLDYRTSGDPRTPATEFGSDVYGQTAWLPTKYLAPNAPMTLADGLEARLIEAEAMLQLQAGGGDWLGILNRLRTDGSYDTQPNAEDPSQTDTLWHVGVGAVAGLRPLADPGSQDARIDLVFRERAFWLYLTGHRQGDLRRLLRDYGRGQEAVYPSGPYQGGSGAYGAEIVAPVPESEQQYNPKYTGCIHHNA